MKRPTTKQAKQIKSLTSDERFHSFLEWVEEMQHGNDMDLRIAPADTYLRCQGVALALTHISTEVERIKSGPRNAPQG